MTSRPRSSTVWLKWKTAISPGNDLVWLNDPANRGRNADTRLLRRVLTPRERLLVQVSTDPDRMLWSLWAAKEAAFKALVREEPSTVFSPQRFEVVPGREKESSHVVWNDKKFAVAWRQGPDWVHAWLRGGELLAVERLPEGRDPSLAARELAYRTLRAGGYGEGRVVERPPVYQEQGGRAVPLSLSHDGPWLAVSAPFPDTAGPRDSSIPGRGQ